MVCNICLGEADEKLKNKINKLDLCGSCFKEVKRILNK